MVVLICVIITHDKFLIQFITSCCLEDFLSANHIKKQRKVCVHVCMCVWCIYACAHAQEGAYAHVVMHMEWEIDRCLPQSFFTLYLRRGILPNSGLAVWLHWLVHKLPKLIRSAQGLWICTTTPGLFYECWGSQLRFSCLYRKGFSANQLYHHPKCRIWKWKEKL